MAAEAGCQFLLASDAHAVRHLEFDRYALAIVARAAIPAERILNFRRAEAFQDWLDLG
jgi:histidinol phosphatase-like PHP family hydrolase